MSLVSLVLATLGRQAEVGRCLQSLAEQSDRNFEVLLMDQNTDDRLLECVEVAQQSGVSLRHFRLDRPSLAGARNLGISEARGSVIGFPDDDCWYEAEVIAQLRESLMRDPGLDGFVADWVEQSGARSGSLDDELLSCAAWRRFRGGDASSISLFFRSTLLARLGGFDERLGVGQWFGAGEETDLILRSLSAGARLKRVPGMRVHHHFGQVEAGALSSRRINARKRARGTGALYAKHKLSPFTIIRGLAAPTIKPAAQMQGWHACAVGAAVSLGRLEGMVKWGWGRP